MIPEVVMEYEALYKLFDEKRANINDTSFRFRSDPGGTVLYLAFFAVCILFSLIIHECAHGWVALKMRRPYREMDGTPDA